MARTVSGLQHFNGKYAMSAYQWRLRRDLAIRFSDMCAPGRGPKPLSGFTVFDAGTTPG
jgi:hypothetical protein